MGRLIEVSRVIWYNGESDRWETPGFKHHGKSKCFKSRDWLDNNGHLGLEEVGESIEIDSSLLDPNTESYYTD